MESVKRTERITDKLRHGLLPATKPLKIWAGFGKGRRCDGCDETIRSVDIEQELDFDDGRTLRLHDACSQAWRWKTDINCVEPQVGGGQAAPLFAFAISPENALLLLAAIVESSDDAIVSKTLDGVITSWNGGADRMFGWPAHLAIGKHISLIVPEDRRAEEDDVLARIRRSERIEHFETVRLARDGRLVDVSLTVSPVRDAAGTIIGASKVARDVSERRRMDQYRNVLLTHEHQARTAAEALIRAKDQFLATISHELRTPLNAIFGWARLLERPELDEQARKRAITAIVNGASAQARLVDDLLDLSRVVTGRLRLDMGPLSLHDVVEAALEAIQPTARAKGIQLVTALVEVHMLGAADRLQQVVWNLLANAVKFSSRGGRIDVVLRHSVSEAEIIVSDNGEGISPDLLPQVFREFWQEDSSPTRAHQGMGLGLTLVKHIVELHGGHVRAESLGKGKGATFTVTLPLT